MSKELEEYYERYGSYPDDKEGCIAYLKSKMKDSDIKSAEELARNVDNIEWDEVKIVLYLIPKSTPRPRWSSLSQRFYVKGAKANKKMIRDIVEEHAILCTRVEFIVESYLPTPLSSASKKDILAAEMGAIRPLSDPDWDNIGKTYTDMLTDVLFMDDNIIVRGVSEKYYSIKPRVEITIRWQTKFDSRFNEKRITRSKSYQKYVELGRIEK